MHTDFSVNPRVIQFLNESNKIEGIHDIDYQWEAFRNPAKGHFGAFVVSQDAALKNEPLTAKMIRQWQAMIGREQKESTGDSIDEEEIGHMRGPNLQKNVRIGGHIPPKWEWVALSIQNWLEDINEEMNKNSEILKNDEIAFSSFVGKYFLNFERIHPFADGNGRTGRLIANYLATRFGRPLLVFPSELSLRNRYIEAHRSQEDMADYIRLRLKESQVS